MRFFSALLLTWVVALSVHNVTGEDVSEDSFRQLLSTAGIDDVQLNQLVDGKPLSKIEIPLVFPLLFRLQQPASELLDHWTQPDLPLDAWLAEPSTHRTELAWIEGQVLSFEKVLLSANQVKVHEYKQLYLCKIKLSEDNGTCLAIVPRVPRSWLADDLLPQPVRFRGLFLKTVRLKTHADQDAQGPLLVSTHISWFPTENAPPGQLLLAAHGMDVALLDEVKHRQPFVKPNVSREGEAFYACLKAVGKAGQGVLSARAKEQLPNVAEYWRVKLQTTADSLLACKKEQETATENRKKNELKQRIKKLRRHELMAKVVSKQATEGRYSVAPLFLQPERQVGRLTIIEGIARRAVRIAGNDASVQSSYYELEVFTADSENLPVVCCVVDVPVGFPLGDTIRQPVRVAGLFFKSWLYRTRQLKNNDQVVNLNKSAQQQRHYAPIVIGAQVEQLSSQVISDSRWGFITGIAFLVLLAAIWVVFTWNVKQDRQRRLRLRR